MEVDFDENNIITKKEICVPEDTEPSYFIWKIDEMYQELRQYYPNEKPLCKITSSLEVKRKANTKQHFYNSVGLTEVSRIEDRDYIVDWIGDPRLPKDKLILEILSEEELKQRKDVGTKQIKEYFRGIISMLGKIARLMEE